MTAREALYQAILDHPDDDLPRLAYADWCDEHGDPDYARFIRAQIEQENRPRWDPVRIGTVYRDYALITGRGFEHHHPAVPPGLKTSVGLRRGFLERVRSDGVGPFVEHAAALMAVAPVRGLRVGTGFDTPTDIAPLADSPYLARLRSLELGEAWLPAAAVRQLTTSPHAAGLTDLDFGLDGIARDGFRELFRSPLLPRLTRLRVGHRGRHRSMPLAAIREAGGPYRLRSLTVRRYHGAARPDVAGLFDAPLLRGLVELDLSGHVLGPAGIDALLASPVAAGLESLGLRRTAPRPEGVRALAASPALAGLRSLNLGSCGIDLAGVQALAASPHLRNLVVLDLSQNPVGDAGAAVLAESPYLRNLVNLVLGVGVTDRGAVCLLESPGMANLAMLHVGQRFFGSRITDPVRRRMKERFGPKFYG